MIERRMQEYRRQLGSFEVVDWVDCESIERMRSRLQVDAPVSVNWQWEYGSEVGELRALYEKGKQNQWNATTELDWDCPVTKNDWLVRCEASQLAMACQLAGLDEATQRAAAFDEVAYTLSQLLHGEQAALQLCGQLTNLCPTTDEKWYAASQVADEARHNEVLARFLSEKMGTIYPVSPIVKALLDELLSVDGYVMKMLGMQTLFEGIAVGIMDMLKTDSQNPLLEEMIRKVQQDESRHAAFGVLTMRRVVRDADEAQMQRMEDWAFSILEALNANQQLDMLHWLCPKYGLDPENVAMLPHLSPQWLELNSQIYMHTVVPNLMRLGLITERTRDQWRERGMLNPTRGESDPELALVS